MCKFGPPSSYAFIWEPLALNGLARNLHAHSIFVQRAAKALHQTSDLSQGRF